MFHDLGESCLVPAQNELTSQDMIQKRLWSHVQDAYIHLQSRPVAQALGQLQSDTKPLGSHLLKIYSRIDVMTRLGLDKARLPTVAKPGKLPLSHLQSRAGEWRTALQATGSRQMDSG